ncbi:MAG: hypothetical protein ACK5NC_11450 [Vibrio sp.]
MSVIKLEILHMSLAKIYIYKNVMIDWHEWLGPSVLNKNTEMERNWRTLNGNARLWKKVGEFARLPDKEKEEYRI